MSKDTIRHEVLKESNQDHNTRKSLFVELEKKLKRPVISFFTSFRFPVMIEDEDSGMIEDILRTIDLSKGLAIIINSPGGSGLAAERIINICRSYSETDEFWAIVPNKAKSAATMICFGADKILMSKTSELGPIDLQTSIKMDEGNHPFSIHNLVDDYEELFLKATKAKGNLDPYMLQLSKYSSKQIKEYKAAIELSNDIAVRALKSGMMKTKKEAEIKKKIEQFLTPKTTKTHGRPIYIKDSLKSDLIIKQYELKDPVWAIIYEIYVRSDNFVNKFAMKCVESKDHGYYMGVPDQS